MRGRHGSPGGREAEVVVRAEVDQLAPFDLDVGALRRGHHELGLVGSPVASLCEPPCQVIP